MIGLVDWQRPQLLWLALVLELFSLLTLIGLDRLTTRGIKLGQRILLFALRFGALSLLAASLMRPVLSLREPAARRGVVAVLVDESASMSVIDTQRTAAQLTPLAAVLDPAVAALRNPELGELYASLQLLQISAESLIRAAGELDYARLSQRSLSLPQARLSEAQRQFDDQRQKALRLAQNVTTAQTIGQSLKAIDVASATTRPTQITNVLQSQINAVNDLQLQSDQNLCGQNPLVSQSVKTLSNASRLQLVQSFLNRVAPALSEPFSVQYFGFGGSLRPVMSPAEFLADQPGTDLPAALRELRQRLVGQRLAAIVVCSDGRQTLPTSADPANVGDLPVYAVNPSANAVQDIAIANLALPRAIFVGTTATAIAELTVAQPKPIDSTLSLAFANHSLDQPIHLAGPTTRASFSVRSDVAGPCEIVASIKGQPNEATLANNSFHRWTRVTNQPMRVGVLSGSNSPNLVSLQSALSANPAWAVQKLSVEAVSTSSDIFFGQDVLVLSDLAYDALPDSAWWAIQRFVRDRGGAVLIVGAQQDIYAEYAQHDSTLPLLAWSGGDVPLLRTWPSFAPSLRIVSANADAIGTLQWADDSEANRLAWRQLPLLSRVVTFPDLLPTAQPLIVDAQTRSPLLVTQPLGLGHVGLFGCDEADRWPSPTIFWQRLLDHLSCGAYAIDDGVLAIDVDSLAPQPDRALNFRFKVTAGVRAELEEAFDRPLLQVTRGGKRYFSQLLSAPSDAFPIRSALTLPNLPAGDYQIALLWADRKVTLPLTVADSLSAELSNVAGDPANLASLINTRGAVLPIEDLPTLPARIEAAADTSPIVEIYPLWDSPYFFVLVVGCFGADWALRQRVGLA